VIRCDWREGVKEAVKSEVYREEGSVKRDECCVKNERKVDNPLIGSCSSELSPAGSSRTILTPTSLESGNVNLNFGFSSPPPPSPSHRMGPFASKNGATNPLKTCFAILANSPSTLLCLPVSCASSSIARKMSVRGRFGPVGAAVISDLRRRVETESFPPDAGNLKSNADSNEFCKVVSKRLCSSPCHLTRDFHNSVSSIQSSAPSSTARIDSFK